MKKQTGFTLIELLVVMTLVTIMSATFITYLRQQSVKGRDTKRKAELQLIKSALEMYRASNDVYPPDNGSGVIKGCGAITPSSSQTACAWGSAWVQTNAQGKSIEYMKTLPRDPKSTWSYYYVRSTTSTQKFYLCSKLENTADQDYQSSPTNCSGYNYQVREP